MSDLLIKNMEIPSSCGECKLVQTYIYYLDECQYLHKKIAHNGRLKGCPLVEVPTHGRLVDADEVQNKMSYYGFRAIDMTIHEFIEDELTTIVEASK